MLTRKPLPFLRGNRRLQGQRERLRELLACEPVVRFLPALLQMPLGLEPLPEPAAILATPTPLALCGPPASGRTLALLQVVERWCANESAVPLLYVSLVADDTIHLPPRDGLANAIVRAGWPLALVEGKRPGILLLDDWESLPADRRIAWRSFLITAAREWTALRVVVALPEGESWPGYRRLIFPNDDRVRRVWIERLSPQADQASALESLRFGNPSRTVSLADLALLALTFPDHGLPSSRIQLYTRAYDQVRSALEAADEASLPTVKVGRALLRQFRLARAFAGGVDIAGLGVLPPVERATVAALVAGLLGDPAPVLAALWDGAAPEAANLAACIACLAELPDQAPRWGLRLLEYLSRPNAAVGEREALMGLVPLLYRILATAALPDPDRTCEVLRALHTALPPAPGRWLPLTDNPQVPATLRWEAADLMVGDALAGEQLVAVPTQADATALQVRAYLAVTAVAGGASLLATPLLCEGAAALLNNLEAGERRMTLARAVLAEEALPVELRTLAVQAVGDQRAIEQVLRSPSAALRQAALARLRSSAPAQATAVLVAALSAPEVALTLRLEVLETLASLDYPTAWGALIRSILDARLPLSCRLRGVKLIADRGTVGCQALRQILAAPGLPSPLRMAAADYLAHLGDEGALPILRRILERDTSPWLRRRAAQALGALGRRPGLADQAAAALIAGLRRAGVDAHLVVQIAQALGRSGADAALPPLRALLAPALAALLRSAWERRAPDLALQPAYTWPNLDLSDEVRAALLDALAEGETIADPPTGLAELCERQAAAIAVAAARALADLACARPDLQSVVVKLLYQTVTNDPRLDVIRAALDGMMVLNEGVARLAALLDDDIAATSVGWLAVERLSQSEAGRAALVQRFHTSNPLLRSAMINALGGRREALSAIRRLARATGADLYLRRVAVAALANFTAPEAVATLAELASDQAEPDEIRMLAASSLSPTPLSEVRLRLQRALHAPQTPVGVQVALARALARCGEREALAILLRFAQSESSAVAVKALEALAELADDTIEPILVAISQNHLTPPNVRLAAVTALLRRSGPTYLALLRPYLNAAALPLRLQAYATLAAVNPDDPQLGAPLSDRAAPLSLRLQALKHLAARDPTAPALIAALTSADEEIQVRLAAADALAQGGAAAPEALAAPLTKAYEQAPSPPLLRRRCIRSLSALARGSGPVAEAALERLSALADDPAQPAEHRHWAGEALIEAMR